MYGDEDEMGGADSLTILAYVLAFLCAAAEVIQSHWLGALGWVTVFAIMYVRDAHTIPEYAHIIKELKAMVIVNGLRAHPGKTKYDLLQEVEDIIHRNTKGR